MYVAQSLPHSVNLLTAVLSQVHRCLGTAGSGCRCIRTASCLSSSEQQQLQLGDHAICLAHDLGRSVSEKHQVSQVHWQQNNRFHGPRRSHAVSNLLWYNQPGIQPTASYGSSAVHVLQDAPDTETNLAAAYQMQAEIQHQRSRQSPKQAQVLDGKAVAAEWSAELQQQVLPLTSALGRPPSLAVVLVGNRPDSLLYVARKQEACQRIGIHCQVMHLSDTISQPTLQEAVRHLADDPSVDGMLVQLPLPRHLDEERVMEFLDPRKDVDGFHPLNMG